MMDGTQNIFYFLTKSPITSRLVQISSKQAAFYSSLRELA